MFRSTFPVATFLLLSLILGPAEAADFQIVKKDDSLVITQGDARVATYLFQSGAKPVLWPVYGPGGAEITRAYPMRDAGPAERSDHIHHRSFWFTHGEVNGIDFWAETKNHGNIVQTDLVSATGGTAAVIETTNDWNGPDGSKVLSDRRRLTFRGTPDNRIIDFDITLHASAGNVNFGDTKEGSFGIRVAGSMKVDAKDAPGGTIVDSEGNKNKDAWGKSASWVDYYGPVGDKTLGVAILNHPSSYHYPTRWHVRTYGLFAANPFGHYHFAGGKKTDGIELPKGESIQLRYRVVLHRGDTQQASIAKEFASYKSLKIEGP